MSGGEPQVLTIRQWMDMIEKGEVQVPEFQRNYVWDPKKAVKMIEAILKDRPVGSLLGLRVDAKIKKVPFEPRSIDGAPESEVEKCEILILDGQQRLTALWHALKDANTDHAYFLEYREDNDNAYPVGHAARKSTSNRTTWIEDNKKCVEKGFIPVHLFSENQEKAQKWIDDAYENEEGMVHARQTRKLEHWIKKMSDKFLDFRIPYLSLPYEISETEAIQAFIESNTSSQPLRKFDITVATMRRDMQDNLRDLRDETWEGVREIRQYVNRDELGDLILKIACLKKDLSPTEGNYTREGVLNEIVNHIGEIQEGLKWTCGLLKKNSILTSRFLPSRVPLRVLPALHKALPSDDGGKDTCQKLAKKYIWRAFFTNRYTSDAASLLLSDYRGLRDLFENKRSKVDILDMQKYPLPQCDQLKRPGWPTHQGTLPRAILALSLMNGAQDLRTGDEINSDNIDDTEAHHIFPRKYLEEKAGIDKESNSPLNCMLIRGRTNRRAGSKSPLEYLNALYEIDIRERIEEHEIQTRLMSHLIPAKLLLEENVTDVRKHYEDFLQERAKLMESYMKVLAYGRDP